jgi:hypothetical protein
MKYPRGIGFSLPHAVRWHLKTKSGALQDGRTSCDDARQ